MANDAVSAWLAAAGRVPLLTPAQEISLGAAVRRWQDWPDGPDAAPAAVRRRGLRARAHLVQANLRLVVTVTKKYASAASRRGVPMVDLLQEGAIGLMRGAEKFDPAKGYKFSTYGYWWIRQAITRSLNGLSGAIKVPGNLQDQLRRLQPGDLEGMCDRERIKLTAAAAALRVCSLDAPMGDDGATLLDLLAG